MKWIIDDSKQIHTQLVEEITKRIILGFYKPGDKIPSVREFAIEAKVNPNTMQKALQELEETKIIVTKRTTGKFVTTDKVLIKNLQQEITGVIVKDFITNLKGFGCSDKEIIEKVKGELK